MSPAGFEPAIPAIQRPQTHAIDHTASGLYTVQSHSPRRSKPSNCFCRSVATAALYRSKCLCSDAGPNRSMKLNITTGSRIWFACVSSCDGIKCPDTLGTAACCEHQCTVILFSCTAQPTKSRHFLSVSDPHRHLVFAPILLITNQLHGAESFFRS